MTKTIKQPCIFNNILVGNNLKKRASLYACIAGAQIINGKGQYYLREKVKINAANIISFPSTI